MNNEIYVLHVLLLFVVVGQTSGQDLWTDVRAVYEQIYDHYYNTGTSLTDVIPVINNSSPMQVGMTMTLTSLNGFDAVKGQIDISGSMLLAWRDGVIFDDILTGATISEVFIDYDKAWAPSIVLVNAMDTIKDIGDTTYKLKYDFTQGIVQWEPRVLLRASCSPDVTFYPFDRQVCDFTYTAWGHTSGEIELSTPTTWDTTAAEDNGVWTIVSTSAEKYTSGGSDYVKFQIVIERQPLYFTFNIVLPILLLGLLNGFVFLLPAESGERVGFCITCFLAFVVLMQTTMTFLPEIASPMSLLCIYVFLMMCCSVTINILCILTLRIYHKPERETVGKCVQIFVKLVCCKFCNCCKKGEHSGEEIDWPTVGRLLDFFFFLSFLGGQSALTFFFIVPLATKY